MGNLGKAVTLRLYLRWNDGCLAVRMFFTLFNRIFSFAQHFTHVLFILTSYWISEDIKQKLNFNYISKHFCSVLTWTKIQGVLNHTPWRKNSIWNVMCCSNKWFMSCWLHCINKFLQEAAFTLSETKSLKWNLLKILAYWWITEDS